MVGHAYLSQEFSERFREILKKEYVHKDTRAGYWEDVYIRHIAELPPLLVNRYKVGQIEEFDSIDELRIFDTSYSNDTRSQIIKFIADKLGCMESELHSFSPLSKNSANKSFTFLKGETPYQYNDIDNSIFTL